MKALVTGAGGFIGQTLLPSLAAQCDAAPYAGDIRGAAQSGLSPDVVFHLAGRTVEDQFQSHPFESLDINVTGTLSVLELCRVRKAHLIFASTSGVYRSSSSAENYSESFPVGPARLYPVSKALAEQSCIQYAQSFNLPVTILRLFNVYGPGQRLPYLVPDIMHAAVMNRPLTVRMPDAVRDFVYRDDVVAAFIAAMRSPPQGCRIVNIGGGRPFRVIDVVGEVERASGKKIALESAGTNTTEVNRMVADISKAREVLGWEPRTDLSVGLKATWQAAVAGGIGSR